VFLWLESQGKNKMQQKITITKKIAKHGRQSVIVIPSVLSNLIQHGMLVKVTIDVLEKDISGGKK
jgi:hypothetical protein